MHLSWSGSGIVLRWGLWHGGTPFQSKTYLKIWSSEIQSLHTWKAYTREYLKNRKIEVSQIFVIKKTQDRTASFSGLKVAQGLMAMSMAMDKAIDKVMDTAMDKAMDKVMDMAMDKTMLNSRTYYKWQTVWKKAPSALTHWGRKNGNHSTLEFLPISKLLY